MSDWGDDDDLRADMDAAATSRANSAPRPKARSRRNRRHSADQFSPQIGILAIAQGLGVTAWQWLSQSYIHEIANGNAFSWCVVAYATGAALYLVLPQEPSFLALSLALAVMGALVALRRRTSNHVFGLTVGLMCVAGVWTGALKSIRVDGPRLDHERTVGVTGWIVDSEAGPNGASRMTMRVATMTGRKLPEAVIPRLVTITFRASLLNFDVGEPISVTARLRPLPGPVMPGGYDFARRAFFDGRGASGYALGRIGKANLAPPDWLTRGSAAIAQLRHTMSDRIRTALPGASGAIAAAIIVGETRGIPDAENDALRMAGLPHMITIAGLHMSIVAGCVFVGIRWLLALFPAVALRYPTKSWAAAGALLATTVYVLISGGHVSAERAYLMSAVMLLAIICGRPALTMRNLGLAALVLLAQNPAQVIEPGFLMSFLAVMALIAAYQAWAAWLTAHPPAPRVAERSWLHQIARLMLRHGAGVMASTLIATLATAAVTADQFYRVSPYSILANVIVFPAIEFVAMPSAVLACLAMPFGLEALPLRMMGIAIDFMDRVGFFVASLPGGNGLVGRIHPWTTALQIGGLCWLCLWHRSWRLLGLVPIVVALCLSPFAVRPDVIIGADAGSVAVRGADGQLRILGARQDRFSVANWLMADAAPLAPMDPRVPLDPHLADGWTCDPLGCVFTTDPTHGALRRVAVVTDARGFDEDCVKADIVVSRLVAPNYCAETAHVFDRNRLLTTGAVALILRPASRSAEGPVESNGTAGPTTGTSAQIHPFAMDVSAALPVGLRPWMPHPPKPPEMPVSATPDPAADPADDLPDIPQPLGTDSVRALPGSKPVARHSGPKASPPLDPTDLPDLPDF